MKLASHNTMTYLKPKKWYMYPFQFLAKCQSKTILQQYKAGVRWFDIRISFNKNGDPEFRHGMIAYKSDFFKVFKFLNSKDDIIVRLLLEKDHPFYYDLCKHLEQTYTNIKFTGGCRKSDWKLIYEFNPVTYTLEENYASMPSNPKWYGIWPWLYAKLHKKKTTNKDYLLIDFI